MTAQSGIREGVASEVGAALEVVGHPRNHLLVLSERVNDKLGIKALLDDAAFVLGAPFEQRLVDFGEPLLSGQLEKSGPECSGKSHDRTGVVHVFIDQLDTGRFQENLTIGPASS